jgi:ACR3 family arsenite efflux pump ArsB
MRYLAFALASAFTACRPGTDAHFTERPARPTSSAENGVIAILTAVALYGPGSGAALATVVGVLVEVPVRLSVCSICNRTRGWFGPEPVPAPAGDAHV